MTDLPARLAALPEWGDPDSAEFDDEAAMALRDSLAAALARLALAREWIEQARHLPGHQCAQSYPSDCPCGRDALLKALEVPT